jgi:hypothetical protein
MRTIHSSYTFDETLGARLSRLRELLVAGEELAEASDYFHEALVPDESFLKSGADGENPRLLAVVGGVLNTIAPGGELACPMTLRLEEHAMCHGCAFWRDGIVLFFYFEDLDLGLCSYQRHLSSPNVQFARFAVTQAASGWHMTRQRGRA